MIHFETAPEEEGVVGADCACRREVVAVVEAEVLGNLVVNVADS